MNYILQGPENARIQQGDTCVIYISEHLRYILKIQPDASLQTKFGLIRSMDLLNHPYGVRFECKRGWILPLRLTPELWTQLLPHRTQILYQTDISVILLQLDIKPGSIVVESGTGSGSLSHAILRACLPNGFLYTYDVNESRLITAQQEFKDHGYGNNVRVTCKNICESGYDDDLEGKADACILDLPQTWSAIEHAHKVLKPDGSRLCTFSPCIEQVQQNVTKMTELKFKDIVTIECLIRPFDVKLCKLRNWTDEILDDLTTIDQVRIENLKNSLNPNKRSKICDEFKIGNQVEIKPGTSLRDSNMSDSESNDPLIKALTDPKASFHPNMLPVNSHLYAQQYKETVSHSGYLTFASKRL